MQSERTKYLRNQAAKQLDRYLKTGQHPNGSRNRHARHGAPKHTTRAKSAKRARSKVRMRSHRGGK
jgi:hypothetical protein